MVFSFHPSVLFLLFEFSQEGSASVKKNVPYWDVFVDNFLFLLRRSSSQIICPKAGAVTREVVVDFS